MTSQVAFLNQRLAESLGRVCSGTYPRFQWKYAPDELHIVYDRDNRTILRKSWAESPGPDGHPIGRSWLIAQWTISRAADNMGFLPQCPDCSGRGKVELLGIGSGWWQTCESCAGTGRVEPVRLTAARRAGYVPHFETALPQDFVPNEDVTAKLIWEIRRQLDASIEQNERSFENYMMEEKHTIDANERRDSNDWRQTALGQYDQWTGAMGNCEPGTAGGYLSVKPRSTGNDIPAIGFEDI